jgi:hypothetical protein
MTVARMLSEIEAFLGLDGVSMTETTFGRLAVNDGKLVPRLRAGGSCTLTTADKVRAFITANRPKKRKAA